MPIPRLSTLSPYSLREGNAVGLVGSLAPIHSGHIDALQSAGRAVANHDGSVEALVLIPNSSEYVQRKLGKVAARWWSFLERVDMISNLDTYFDIPVFVDDISGADIGLEQINDVAPITIEERLGLEGRNTYLVVGSDQLPSMEDYLSDMERKAVCVIRPGHHDEIQDSMNQKWAKQAIAERRLLVTLRSNMENDISSTEVRKNRAG